MTTELKYLRQLYLEDLRKEVCYDGHNRRPRVRFPKLWESVQSTLKEGIDEQIQLPNTERDVWLWSDLHFGHNNIIRFSDRPFINLEVMHEHLIANFNDYVKPTDISIWVGDVTFMGNDATNELLNQCNGYKILVVGNHDFNKKKLRNLNFDEVHLLMHIPVDGVDLVLTHYPMENLPFPYINVHGHLHAGGYNKTSIQHINVNCEFTNYRPVHIDDIVNISQLRIKNMDLEC